MDDLLSRIKDMASQDIQREFAFLATSEYIGGLDPGQARQERVVLVTKRCIDGYDAIVRNISRAVKQARTNPDNLPIARDKFDLVLDTYSDVVTKGYLITPQKQFEISLLTDPFISSWRTLQYMAKITEKVFSDKPDPAAVRLFFAGERVLLEETQKIRRMYRELLAREMKDTSDSPRLYEVAYDLHNPPRNPRLKL